jgi:hypothetical protein
MGGAARKDPSDVERAAVAFQSDRTHEKVLDLLVELNKDFGVRVYRPPVLRACLRALELCCGPEKSTFLDAAIRMREQNRVLGRSLPRRAVGSTLLLKGLEAEVVVILNADSLNARNLYVAMTRGSKRTIICGRNPVLTPIW